MENSAENQLKNSEKIPYEYSENKSSINRGFLIFAVISFIFTLIFIFTDLEIQIQNAFFDATAPQEERFIYADSEPWHFLYEQEGAILISVALFALILIFTSWVNGKKKPVGRYGWYIITVALVGTGLIVNAIFKGYWGRPRPREVYPYDQNGYEYHPVWWPHFKQVLANLAAVNDGEAIRDALGNSSFSAGHPTEAIVLIALFMVLSHPEVMVHFTKNVRKSTKILFSALFVVFLSAFLAGIVLINKDYTDTNAQILAAGFLGSIIFASLLSLFRIPPKHRIKIINIFKYIALGISVVGGILMGIGRAVQFGHWPSDSLWSFIFVYMSAYVLYYYVFDFPTYEKEWLKKWKDPSYEMKPCRPIWAGMVIFLGVLAYVVSTIWFVEYSIRPDIFQLELIAGIVLDIGFTVAIYFAIRSLNSYKK